MEADDEIRSWLTYKVMTWSLAPGLPPSGRWSIIIEPAVGEPFLGSWKAYLASQVLTRHAVASAGNPFPPPRGVKRALSARVPPSASKRARVERLRAVKVPITGALAAGSLAVSLSDGGLPLPSDYNWVRACIFVATYLALDVRRGLYHCRFVISSP